MPLTINAAKEPVNELYVLNLTTPECAEFVSLLAGSSCWGGSGRYLLIRISDTVILSHPQLLSLLAKLMLRQHFLRL